MENVEAKHSGFISVMGTLLQGYQQSSTGMPNLNTVTNTDDGERSGHPKSAVVPENITKVHKIVLSDRQLKLREIADTLKISKGSLFTILDESLGMRKLFSKWVLRLLTPDQKQQRV